MADVPLYAKVTWGNIRYSIQDTLDGSERDPDKVPVNGLVTFTPMVAVPYIGFADSPETLIPKVQAAVITEGVLYDSYGQEGVTLLGSSTGTQRGWTWRVHIELTDPGQPTVIPDFNIRLDGASPMSTLDLTTVMPVSSSGGTAVTQGRGVKSITSDAATGVVTVTYSDGTSSTFALPPGPGGDPGPPGPAGGSDAATAEWILTGPETRAALATSGNIDQGDLFALVRDNAPRYTVAELVRLGSTMFQVELHDGASGATYSWVKDPADDFFKLSQCSVGYGLVAGPWVTILDANHTGTWASITGQNRYTLTVGAGFTLTVPAGASDLALRVLRNDSGGLWNVSVDGAPSVPVSCWSSLAAPGVEVALVPFASGLDRSKTHTIVATFAGADPAHAPSGTARGWVRKDDAAGTLVGSATGAAPTTAVLASVSNKEFAWSVTAGGQTQFIPEHSGVPSAFAQTPMQIFVDGAPVNFTGMANGARLPVKTSVEVRQRLTGRVAGIDVLDLTSVHTLDAQGRLSYSGRWRALASAQISGYPLMLPNGDATNGEFVTSIGSWQRTKADESTVGFPLDSDAVASGAVLSSVAKDAVGAATVRNAHLTLRRGQPYKLAAADRLFVWHRAAPSAPKMYWSSCDKWPIAAGMSYAWGFDMIVAQIPGIYGILRPS